MDNKKTVVPSESDMLNWILTTLKDKGLELLLLGLAVWFLQAQNLELRKEVTACQQSQIESLKEKNRNLESVLQQNTIALEQLTKIISAKK
jgi:hypothetical protein